MAPDTHVRIESRWDARAFGDSAICWYIGGTPGKTVGFQRRISPSTRSRSNFGTSTIVPPMSIVVVRHSVSPNTWNMGRTASVTSSPGT